MSEQTQSGFSPLISRLCAIAILASMATGIWILVVSPIAGSLAGDWERLSFAEAKLRRYAALIEAQPAMRARLAKLRTAAAGQERFFQGSNSTLLSAELQQSVQRIITGAGAEVGSSQTVAVRPEQGFSRLGLQLTLTTSARSLYRVLYDLENASPMIIIDRLTVTVPESGVSYSAVADGQPGLNVALELAAYSNPSPPGRVP